MSRKDRPLRIGDRCVGYWFAEPRPPLLIVDVLDNGDVIVAWRSGKGAVVEQRSSPACLVRLDK